MTKASRAMMMKHRGGAERLPLAIKYNILFSFTIALPSIFFCLVFQVLGLLNPSSVSLSHVFTNVAHAAFTAQVLEMDVDEICARLQPSTLASLPESQLRHELDLVRDYLAVALPHKVVKE